MIKRKELAKGEILFAEGDQCRHMYVISKGEISLSKEKNGRTVEIAGLNAGDFLGEMALLTDSTRTCTATAKTAVSLLIYDENEFRILISTNNGVALRIIDGLVERLKNTTESLLAPLDIL